MQLKSRRVVPLRDGLTLSPKVGVTLCFLLTLLGSPVSIDAISWVFKQDIKPSWLKFVLVALADCASAEWRCWPSIAHLCQVTGLDRKTIIKAVKILEEKLKEKLADSDSKKIILRVDKDALNGQLTDLMGRAKDAGALSMTIATEQLK